MQNVKRRTPWGRIVFRLGGPDRNEMAPAREGTTIGTSLDKLEAINSGPFSLTGFGWDYEGRTVSWQKGKLPKQLQLDLKPIKTVPDKAYDSVLGDRYFGSSFQGMKKLNLAVEKIFVRWD